MQVFLNFARASFLFAALSHTYDDHEKVNGLYRRSVED